MFKRMVIAVQVIAVQLNSKLTAFGMVNAQVPASAYSQVVPVGDYMDQVGVHVSNLPDDPGCTICGVVVHHNKVEFKPGFL